MKRSEMLDLMWREVMSTRTMHTTPMQDLNKALSIAEKHGMLPPPYYDRYFDDEPECDGYLNEWEPEE